MKIVIVTQEDLFYLPAFIDTILQKRKNDVVGIVILSALEQGNWTDTLKSYFNVYSKRDFAILCAKYARHKFFSVLEKSSPQKKLYSVGAAAARHNIPVIETDNINSKDFIKRMRDIAPDVILSVNSSQVFKKELLSLPQKGCINVHGALLPKNRGRLPSFWVLANDEKETGATVHFMDEKLDNGPIILQERIPVAPDDTQHSLIMKTKAAGARLVLDALDLVESGKVETKENDAAKATVNRFPTTKDGERFRKLGRRLF